MDLSASHASASDEIEQRLASASQAVREQDLCTQQHRQLSAREETAAAELEAARKSSTQQVDELQDRLGDQIVAVTDRLEDMARERWRLLAR